MGNCVSCLSRGNSSTSTDPQCRTELENSSTSTALQRQMELRDSSTSTDRKPQMEVDNSSTSTALQHQMELGDSSISIDRQPQMELKNSSTSTALQPQMELENSSTSTDLQCPTELENSSTSTVLQCQMELGDSSTSTDRRCRMELENSSTTSALQRQMELGDSSTSTAKQMELGDSSTSTTWQRQMELGDSSISTGRPMEMVDSSTSIVLHHQRESAKAFDGIVPEASLSYSTLRKKGPCDVFINHRGDVKHKLASTIYHTLDLVGLRAFLDLEELELGDCIPQELEEVMSTAGLHIAIFSNKYAESAWCLAELSFMLKTGTPILPVFYHVQNDDLRWVAQGKGLYAHAFSEHEKKGRYSSNMLEEWKAALQRVSYFSGYMLNSSNDDEGMLLKSIVNSVFKVIRKEPLEVAKHPVGMDEVVKDFERRRQECIESEQQVQIVGIVGFGGSGKTTLATELYNRKSSSIKRSSFLYDVRDAASKNALHTEQKKLLEDLRIKNQESFDNVKEGKGIVADRLKNLCVLIVLDDVDHEDQLDALLPPKGRLGSGSLVIVTTREMDVLRKWGITSIYKMKPLQDFHAKQLFCWHAFLQPSPQEGFENLVEKCLAVCNGLPLSLKVIGGQLYGRRSKDYWVSQIDKIQRILPEEIKQRLKISYEALDKEEREIFLDIACFFIGVKRSSGIAVWDGSDWSGLHSLERLLNKCLVEVDEKECIRMHDHLRDLGREIASTHSPSRFWFQRQSTDIQRGMPIRGIMAATGFREEELPRCHPPFKEYMEMMRISNLRLGLQILVVRENDFTQEFGDLSRSLLWLRWFHFGQSYLPSWLSLENIRVLELIYPQGLKTLWEDAHPPLELRELVIRFASKFQSFPQSIGHLKHLKKLSLVDYGETELSSLPEEFCELHMLEHLDLEGCKLLHTLPGRFGDLKRLRHINLSGCLSLKMLPVSFKQLINLEFLNLNGCKKLTLESNILVNITNLKVFNVSGCRMLRVLPHNITNQASLGELDLSFTSSLRELPATIGQLSKLEKLEIVGSPLLTRLPSSLGNLSSLVTLTLKGCDKLESLPVEVRQLSNLKNLIIQKCSLRELDFGSGLRLPSSLRELKEIYLSGTSVSRISLPQDCCPSLETLRVEDCASLLEIDTLPTALKLIELSRCKVLESIGSPEAFEQLSNLQTLRIGDCSIKELAFGRGSSSSSLRGLKEIYLSGTSVSRISLPQDCCPSLETLIVEDCASLLEIDTLPTALKLIEFSECKMLESIGSPEAFEQLSNLQTLWIRDCSIKELAFGRGSSSSSLQMLREIYISGTSVSRISLPQGCCSSLETLRVKDCASLLEIDTLPTALKLIKLSRCKVLESIGSSEAFEQLSNLKTLEIRECSIRELPFGRGSSSSLRELKKIYPSGTSVSRISLPQDGCPSLETLSVKDCPSLTEIETLPTTLKLIKFSRCKMLESIGSPEPFELLSNLQTLKIKECSIRELPFGTGSSSSSSLYNLRRLYLDATHLSMVSISQECYPTLHELQIHNEEYLREIETLPAALKSITLNKCKMLKNIRGIHTVVNVQKLSILECPEFDEIPSLAGFVSLDNLEVRDCHKIKKIEGIEHLTSLKELTVQTCWMVPGIDSLGRTERLRRLNLQADTISALEPCIQSQQIENWPRQMTITAGIFPGVCSILDSFTFPGLTVVNSFETSVVNSFKSTDSSDGMVSMRWSLTCTETNLSNAAIVLFLVDCCHEGSFLELGNRNCTSVRLSKGGVVVISVFAEVSPLINKQRRKGSYLEVSMKADTSEDKWHDGDGVKRGSLITGERGSVFEAFKRLFQTLCKATSMT